MSLRSSACVSKDPREPQGCSEPIPSALLPSKAVFCHTQAATELSLVTDGRGTGTPTS